VRGLVEIAAGLAEWAAEPGPRGAPSGSGATG